jgi:hypothetical protein
VKHVSELTNLLDLERIEVNLFRGESRTVGSPRVFGGQVMAQALSAALRTVPEAIDAGVLYLLTSQNKDGSWGSPYTGRAHNIYAPTPGGHKSFRTGSTALAISGLLHHVGPDRPEALAAAKRGVAWLHDNLPKLRRDGPMALYCNWGFLFGIEALIDYEPHASFWERRRSRKAIAYAVDRLERYRGVRGGWGYYDFDLKTQRNGGWPASFMTAAVLGALSKADANGHQFPADVFPKAIAELRRCRLPDNAFLYNFQWQYRPRATGNRPAGSLGRSQAGLYGLRMVGGPAEVSDDDIRQILARFLARNDWLGIGRKRPVPHESWFHVAGYYYCFGHAYAARCIRLLPAEEQVELREQQAQILIKSQEKDGSWWDYPLYGYGKAYGTGLILQTFAK